MTAFFIIGGVVLIGAGLVGLFKYRHWKQTGTEAVCLFESVLSCDEQKAGGFFSSKKRYKYSYRTEITGGGRITHGIWREIHETREEGKRRVGKKIKGWKDDTGEFLDAEGVDALRKSALGKIGGGAACLLIALVRVILFHPFG